jgi:hypothetical protein
VNTLIRRPVLAVNDPGKSFRTSIMLKQESAASWGRPTRLPILMARFPTYVDIAGVWTEVRWAGCGLLAHQLTLCIHITGKKRFTAYLS